MNKTAILNEAPWQALGEDVAVALAPAIFAYIDELSAASADGYAYEQSLAARAEQELRTRLLEALLREPPATPDEVVDLARAAGWELPATLGVLVFEPTEPDRVGL